MRSPFSVWGSPFRSRSRRFLFTAALLTIAAFGAACGRKHDLPGEISTSDCQVSPTAIDFGSVQVGTSSDRTFTLTNQGVAALAGSVAESCSDLSVVGDPAYALEPGGSRTFTLRFAPAAAGQTSCSLTIGECGTLPVSGAGQLGPPSCTVAPTVLDFGTVQVGATAQRSFTITNEGGSTLTGTVSESCPEFSIVGNASYDLAPGEEATLNVRFAPTSAGGKNCVLDTGGACADVSASGTAELPPTCEVSTSSLSFGTVNVGQSADRSFTIRNTGGGTLSGSVSESCSEFSIVGGASFSLTGNQTATFTVRFTPSSSGVKNCTIDTGTGCSDVGATGTGQQPPDCGVSTTSLAFGTVNVGQSADRTFTITNNGGGTLSGTVSESCAEFSIVGSASYSLTAGQSATITVRFTPLTGGGKNCTIDTGSSGCADVAASGTGELLAANCQLSVSSIDFEGVDVGQVTDRQLVVTNVGGGTLSGTLTESCPEFSVVGTASYSLAALESAIFTLRFAPTTAGDFDCTLAVGSNCGNVALSGQGVPVIPPACQLSATSYDFGSVEVDRHEDVTIDIANVGGGQLCGTASESCDAFLIVSEPTYCAIPGTPYRLRIRFRPPSEGDFECVVDPGGGCGPITVRGSGVD